MTEEQRDLEPEVDEAEDSPRDDSSQGNDDNAVRIEDYKNLQSAYTKSNQELGRLQAKIEQLEESQQEPSEEFQTVDSVLDSLDDDEIRSRVDADPAEAIPILKEALKGAVGTLEGQFVEALRERDAYYHSQFKERDPAYQQAKGDIYKLREDPAFANLPDETLMAVLAREKGNRPKSEFRGNAGSGMAPKPMQKEEDIRKTDLYKRMYGGEL